MTRFLVTVVITVHLMSIYFPLIKSFKSKFPENQNWKCIDCQNSTQELYGFIRYALVNEIRDIYLNFDHFWMDKLLKTRASVLVKRISIDGLASMELSDDYRNLPTSPETETYDVIISIPEEPQAMNLVASNALDTFLEKNPCWLPLKEPPVQFHTLQSSIESNDTDVRTLTELHSRFYGIAERYFYSTILVRLPTFPYHSTCQLFKLVTKQQHPEKCPEAGRNKVVVQHLGNIGWANCLHPLIEHLMDALHNGKVFISPRAADSGHLLSVNRNGQRLELEGRWTWSDPNECSHQLFVQNPWACHFISLSPCNTFALRDEPYSNARLADPEGGSDYLRLLGDIVRNRTRYGDGPLLEGEWEKTRLIAFAMRPNVHTRAHLRHSLTQVVELSPLSSPHSMARELNSLNTKDRHGGSKQRTQVALSAPYWVTANAVPHCLALHIRHGDSANDFRGRTKLDRSLEAHVACAEGLAMGLGTKTVMLATDDPDTVTSAARDFPNLVWAVQQRALGRFNGSSFGYFHEKTKRAEVANLLADMILLSRCDGFVGAFDSALTCLMMQVGSSSDAERLVSCGRNAMGQCPPSRNLWDCQPRAYVEGDFTNMYEP